MEQTPAAPALANPATILVVDDEEAVLRILGQWVQHLGYALRSADSADAAVAELERGGVAAALCDVRMPGRDGLWLVDQVRDRFPDVAVVLVTGLDELDAGVTLRPGVVGYVTKPFERETISASIRSALAWHQSHPGGATGSESLFDLATHWEPTETAS